MAVLNFSAARSQHLAWKAKLQDFLEGRATLTEKQAASHTDCELGKWLYSTGLDRFGSLTGTKELEKVHAEMHATIKRIIQLKAAGNSAAAAQEFNKVGPASDKVISLLKGMEVQVKMTQ
jgi:methyl-accepting chemotaxis protein